MRVTLSRSAGTITSTDGRQPTDLNFGNTFVAPFSLRWRLELLLIRIAHMFGVHNPVEVHEWDIETGSIKYIGMRCLICETEC